MQTFLPYPDFKMSASILDNKRLGKQRVETYQVLNVLFGETKSKGWQHHPAVLMWKGYEVALINYGICICTTWIAKGYKDTVKDKIQNLFYKYIKKTDKMYNKMPSWFGLEAFHKSHRSNLLRKDKEFYGRFFNDVDDSLPYWWPSHHQI